MIVLWMGCTGTPPPPPPSDNPEPNLPTGDTAAGNPTADTGPTTPPGAAIANVEATIHPVYTTLIEVSWDQERSAAVVVEYEVDPGQWRAAPESVRGVGPQQEWLLGVPFAHDVAWRLRVDGEIAVQGQTRSGDPPMNLPLGEVWSSDPARWDASIDYILVSVSYDDLFYGEYMSLIVDRSGRAVWAHPSPEGRSTMHPRISWDGDALLLDYGSFWGGNFEGAGNSEVVALKLDGTEVQRWATPGLYHPFTDMPDGSLAYARHGTVDLDDDGFADGEGILILPPGGGEAIERFHCSDWIAVVDPGALCGANTLSYDPIGDVFLYSQFIAHGVIEVDATTGAVDRWFGQIAGAWSIEAPGGQFWKQHGSVYTADGTLLISTYRDEFDFELVAREYSLDPVGETLTEIWSYGEGQGVTGKQMGEAHRLPSGNTLHNYGTSAVLKEVTPAGDVVWDLRFEDAEYQKFFAGHVVGRSAVIEGDLYRFVP